MMLNMLRKSLFLFAMMLMAYCSFGQEKYSEDQIKVQEMFIEASKKKLLGNLDKAIELYNSVLREDETNNAAMYELARVYIQQEKMSKGQEWAEKAVAQSPKNIWYQQFLLRIYEQMGQFDDAIVLSEQIVSNAPDNIDHYMSWASFHLKAGQFQEAIDVYDTAEKRFGISESLSSKKSDIYLNLNKEKKAEKELRALVETFPYSAEYKELLAAFYLKTNKDEDALAVYRKILEIDPDNVKAQMAMAGSNTASSNELNYLESLKAVFNQPEASINLKIKQLLPSISKIAEGQKVDADYADKVLELTDILEEVHPQEAQGFAAAADVLYHMERYEEARSKYKMALEKDETIFSVWEQLMRTDLKSRNYEGLYEASYEALDIFPNQSIIYYYNGYAAFQLGKYDEALSILDQALLMSAADEGLALNIQALIGRIYNQMGDQTAFDAAFKKALSMAPDNANIKSTYAYELAEAEIRLDQAAELAEQALKADKKNPQYLHVAAWVAFRQKKYDEAQKLMLDAMASGLSNDPIVLEHYGDILFVTGKKEEAVNYWKKAQQNGNASELLNKKINEKKLYE